MRMNKNVTMPRNRRRPPVSSSPESLLSATVDSSRWPVPSMLLVRLAGPSAFFGAHAIRLAPALPATVHTVVSPQVREAGMEGVYETLYERVDELLAAHKR